MITLEPGEYVARCPECGARRIVGAGEVEPPGHLHGIEGRDLTTVAEGEARYVAWEREEVAG